LLRVKSELWCDVCGSYPAAVQYHHPSSTYFTYLAVNASGALVLPEGWCTGDWAETTMYCSEVCKARVLENEAKKATGKSAGDTDRPDLYCCECNARQWRKSGPQEVRYVLPPGWSCSHFYLLCGACSAKPTIQEKYRKINAAYDPL
jgi:hypothetical protein